MEITLRIPDDFARLLGTTGEIERRALEALALEEFKRGHLTKPELRRLLGIEVEDALDAVLQAHGASLPEEAPGPVEAGEAALGAARRAKARKAAEAIIARRKGVTLGGLKIKDLIEEGRR